MIGGGAFKIAGGTAYGGDGGGEGGSGGDLAVISDALVCSLEARILRDMALLTTIIYI